MTAEQDEETPGQAVCLVGDLGKHSRLAAMPQAAEGGLSNPVSLRTAGT